MQETLSFTNRDLRCPLVISGFVAILPPTHLRNPFCIMALAPHLRVNFFHAHIYFQPSHAKLAQRFRERMQAEWKDTRVTVHDLHHQPIGPHPLPMFEADFYRPDYTDFITWLQFNRPEELPILIHPYTEQPLADHTLRPLWLGQQPPGPHGGIKTGILEAFESHMKKGSAH